MQVNSDPNPVSRAPYIPTVEPASNPSDALLELRKIEQLLANNQELIVQINRLQEQKTPETLSQAAALIKELDVALKHVQGFYQVLLPRNEITS